MRFVAGRLNGFHGIGSKSLVIGVTPLGLSSNMLDLDEIEKRAVEEARSTSLVPSLLCVRKSAEVICALVARIRELEERLSNICPHKHTETRRSTKKTSFVWCFDCETDLSGET